MCVVGEGVERIGFFCRSVMARNVLSELFCKSGFENVFDFLAGAAYESRAMLCLLVCFVWYVDPTGCCCWLPLWE